MSTPTLAVFLGGSSVGTLEYFEDDERYIFSFDPAWLQDPARPTLGQIFEDRRPRPIEFYDGRYEHIAAVLHALCPEDVPAFVERVVFCALAGNGDAHLKNWSLRYEDGRHARLSPAYDLVATVVYPPRDVPDELALSLAGSQRFADVRLAAFEPLARVCGRSFDEVAGVVRDFSDRTRTYWREHARDLGYSDAERARIESHMARVPLA